MILGNLIFPRRYLQKTVNMIILHFYTLFFIKDNNHVDLTLLHTLIFFIKDGNHDDLTLLHTLIFFIKDGHLVQRYR